MTTTTTTKTMTKVVVDALIPTMEILLFSSSSTTAATDKQPVLSLLASRAMFGPVPPMMKKQPFSSIFHTRNEEDISPQRLMLAPANNPQLCNNLTIVAAEAATTIASTGMNPNRNNHPPEGNKFIFLVPRGGCTYQQKAYYAQQMGATGLIIYNNMASRYFWRDVYGKITGKITTKNNTTTTGNNNRNATHDIGSGTSAGTVSSVAPPSSSLLSSSTELPKTAKDVYLPRNFYDYDCNVGSAMIPTDRLALDPLPYNAEHNDPLLSGNDRNVNLCLRYSTNGLKSCPSKRCFITDYSSSFEDKNTTTITKTGSDSTSETPSTTTQACCAWDFHIYMYPDLLFMKENITIPTVFITMPQGEDILKLMTTTATRTKKEAEELQLFAVISSRWRFAYSGYLSSFILWILAVTITAIAAHSSASRYREKYGHDDNIIRSKKREYQEKHKTDEEDCSTQIDNEIAPNRRNNNRSDDDDVEFELKPIHAVGFALLTSCVLVLFFYFQVSHLSFLFLTRTRRESGTDSTFRKRIWSEFSF